MQNMDYFSIRARSLGEIISLANRRNRNGDLRKKRRFRSPSSPRTPFSPSLAFAKDAKAINGKQKTLPVKKGHRK